MPIREFLDVQKFDPETTRIMGVAFEAARASLRLRGRGHLANRILASKIIAFAKRGERDPERLCERVLADLSPPPPIV